MPLLESQRSPGPVCPSLGTGKRRQCSQLPRPVCPSLGQGSGRNAPSRPGPGPQSGPASPTHGLFSFTGPCAWTFSWAGLHWSSKRIYTGFSLAVLRPLPRDSEADSPSGLAPDGTGRDQSVKWEKSNDGWKVRQSRTRGLAASSRRTEVGLVTDLSAFFRGCLCPAPPWRQW